MNPKWERRQRKLYKRRHGMRVTGRSVLLLSRLKRGPKKKRRRR